MEYIEYIKAIGAVFGVIIQCGTIIGLAYAAKRFLGKPNADQRERNDKQDQEIRALKERVDKIDERLDRGDAHFDQIDSGNKIVLRALSAIIDHEIDGNHKDQLIKVSGMMNDYLIDK